MTWRHFAFRLPDLEELHGDLPLNDVILGERLNAPGDLKATILNADAYATVRLDAEFGDVPVIEARGTVIVSQHLETGLTYGNIIEATPDPDPEQRSIALIGAGPSSVMDKLPWLSAAFDGIDVDPLDVARMLVAEAASYSTSLPLESSDTTSPVRIGEPLRDVEFTAEGEDVSFEAGPQPRLSSHGTPDIYKVFQDMSEETPHDWHEVTTLGVDGPPRFRIEFGYPETQYDAQAERPVFEIGSDVLSIDVENSIPYASEVFVTAGSDFPHIQAHVLSEGRRRLRTVHVIEDKSLGSIRQARNRADAVMAEIDSAYNILRYGGADPAAQYISKITVKDDAVPVKVGDIVELKGFLSWGYHWQAGRIVSIDRNLREQQTALELQPWEVD